MPLEVWLLPSLWSQSSLDMQFLTGEGYKFISQKRKIREEEENNFLTGDPSSIAAFAFLKPTLLKYPFLKPLYSTHLNSL